jgi:DNA ligase-1
MTRALAQATDIEEATLAHRIMGNWTPATTTFHDLILKDDPTADASKPYPFYLAYQLEDLDALGPATDWNAEFKWDGIRGQLIIRADQHFLWSRGEELITERFPEFATLPDYVPNGTVFDGEILAWDNTSDADKPLPFSALQKRINRKTVPKTLLQDAPAILYAYDLLEHDGQDLRPQPLAKRREILDEIVAKLPNDVPVKLSASVQFQSWDDLAQTRTTSRDARAEGLMLKRLDSPYLSGRKKGDWWKWKVDPLMIDAVMIYAQSGSGRRAGLFTDFTFAVWNGPDLVPFTKAYSGLTDNEFKQITAWVKKNTEARFGPVRQVTPHHVFEIAFEGIAASPRHKSGIALRFPRMSRWRTDKPMAEANTLDDLKHMLDTYG